MSCINCKFKCYAGCGWCCRIDKYSSEEEFMLAREALGKLGIDLKGIRLPNNYIGWPKPCPALKDNKCLIYEVRPYPCRLFLCGKQSKKDMRPFKSEGVYNMEYLNWLLKNNKEFAEIKEKLEDEAAGWGLKHGWKLKKVNPND